MKRLQLALRWKVMLTVLLISVAVVTLGAVQSDYAPAPGEARR